MSSTGSGYDYSCGTFSPDGRIFQVEYAQKAVENSGTAIALKCSDGILVAVEKPQKSRLLVQGSNRRIFNVDAHAGIAITGVPADGRQIVNRGRDEAKNYLDTYGHKIVPSILSNRLAQYVHTFTLYGSLRPFGSAAIIAAFDEDLKVPELYMIDPSGLCFKYFACAAGKGAQAAKTELEKILNKRDNTGGITVTEAVGELANIMYVIRDPSKDKPFELEMGWLCEESAWRFALIPPDLLAESDSRAREALSGSAAMLTSTEPIAEQISDSSVSAGGLSAMDT